VADKHKALSASRGNTLGVYLFDLFLRFGGLNRACEAVYFVCLYYILFDGQARRAAMPYVRHRYPDAGGLKRLWYVYRMFVSQGQSLLESLALRSKFKFDCRFENRDAFDRELAVEDRGLVLLTSHFGCWQAIMIGIKHYKRPVNLLVSPERNESVRKAVDADPDSGATINIISNADPTGGMIDVVAALGRGEIVCIMGDRCMEEEGVGVDFLGETARFPLAAFLLASMTECPVIPIFMVRDGGHSRFIIRYGAPVDVGRVHRKRRAELLARYVSEYASELESMTRRYPFQCFLFDDVWRTAEKRKPPDGS